jgi:ribosomal protein L7/L12
MADIKALAEELVNLTVKEVNELATILKEEYGIRCCRSSCCRPRRRCSRR